MEMTVGLFLLILIMAFVCEWLDSSLGMGYGTILSPVLIIMGFNPLVSIPAILISQAFGGLTASIFHSQFGNVSFKRNSKDLKIAFVVTLFGIMATILAAIISLNIPKVVLKTYIGVLVLVMGIITLRNIQFKFSWKKIISIGVLSAFNKGLSGGGFGPVVTSGQILAGQKHKGAIGVTTLAEAPICIVGFLTYLIGRSIGEFDGAVMSVPVSEFFSTMFSPHMVQWELALALILGSVLVAPFGALTTRNLNKEKMHVILGVLVTVLGAWTLLKTYVF